MVAACLGALGTLAGAQTVTQGAQWTNQGEYRVPEFTGHVLTSPGSHRGVGSILYCPSEADDPAYRAAISAAAGGATVDYFDTRAATPDLPTLQNYDCVYTWANFAFFDNVMLGDNLALFSDGGGTVVLGSFCTFTSGNFLSGNIMTSAYCPVVSPSGTNHFTLDRYQGDGTSCIYDNVTSNPGIVYRDILVLQGGGVADGSYNDGEICHAYQSNASSGATIVYSNGCGAIQLTGAGGGGDWPIVVANSCSCLGTGLTGLPDTLSLAAGGVHILTLNAGANEASNLYLILGAFGPGPTPYPGGPIPLSIDAWLIYTLNNPNLPPYAGNAGILNSSGVGVAQLTVPAGTDPALAGLVLYHAGVTINVLAPASASFVAGPTTLTLAP